MTGLQHGVATVGTHGRMTDGILRRADGEALLLAPVESAERFHDCVLRLTRDRDLRQSVGAGAQKLYSREFGPEARYCLLWRACRNTKDTGA
jgi:hypothetical protein